jgi:hypothetical protein
MQLAKPQDPTSHDALYKRKRDGAKTVKQSNNKNINKSASKYLS